MENSETLTVEQQNLINNTEGLTEETSTEIGEKEEGIEHPQTIMETDVQGKTSMLVL